MRNRIEFLDLENKSDRLDVIPSVLILISQYYLLFSYGDFVGNGMTGDKHIPFCKPYSSPF